MLLESKFGKKIVLMLALISFTSAAQATISLEQRVAEMESQMLDMQLQKESLSASSIKLSGAFNTVAEVIDAKSDLAALKEDTYSLFISKFQVNMSAKPLAQFSFYGSLSGSYLWNSSQMRSQDIQDEGQEELTSSYIHIDKAFVNWKMSDRFTLSFGRLPTQNGPPNNFHTGDARLGTYPLLAYSTPFDGLALTYSDSYSANLDWAARLIYSPFMAHTLTNSGVEIQGMNAPFDTTAPQNSDVFFLNLELHAKQLSFTSELLLLLEAHYIRIGKPRTKVIIGPNGGGWEIGTKDDYLAEVNEVTGYLGIKDIFSLPFDFVMSMKKTFFRKRGGITMAEIGTVEEKPVGGFIYNEDNEGTTFLAAGRVHYKRKYYLGYEYINRTYGAMPSSIRDISFSNTLLQVGQSDHIFFIYNIDVYLAKLIVGYVHTDTTHSFDKFNYVSDIGVQDKVYTQFILRF